MKKKKKWIIIAVVVVVICAIFGGGGDEEEPVTTEPETTVEEVAGIDIVGGEAGEYGSTIDLNGEERVVYHIPAGDYEVTNNGQYANQFNIYTDETVTTDEGYQEPADTIFVELIDAGESAEFSIEDGQYIYVLDGEWSIVQK